MRGVKVPSLDRNKKWHFIPKLKKGDKVEGGDIIGIVNETPLVEHRIMIPPYVHGTIKEIAQEGDYTVEENIAIVDMNGDEVPIKLMQNGP